MENLKGKNIIERMNDLMSYGKTKPNVQEGRNWANLEYSIKAPDGKTYGILRDQTKFYIKESKISNPTIQDFDFIGGEINGSKRHYSSYSGALNYLNLMIAEMNQKNPKSKGINLMECDVKQKSMEEAKEKDIDEKTVLKIPQAQPAQPAPQAQPEPQSQPSNDTELDFSNNGDDSELDLGTDDKPADDDLGDENLMGDDDVMGDGEESEEVKTIQRLTGKLGQKMRDLEQPDNDLTKYVMNSVIAALDLQDLDDSDQKQVMKKLKKKITGEGEMEDQDQDTTDVNIDDTTFDDNGDETQNDDVNLDFGEPEDDQNKEEDLAESGTVAPYGEKKEAQNIKSANAPFSEKPTNIKTESKIQRTLKKYYEYSPEELRFTKDNQLIESTKKTQLLKEGKSKCKSVEQEIALTKVLNYDNGFSIKTMKESVIVETGKKIDLGGKVYQKLIMVESNGKTSGILKDTITKTATQYRMKDKNDYLKFINLGK